MCLLRLRTVQVVVGFEWRSCSDRCTAGFLEDVFLNEWEMYWSIWKVCLLSDYGVTSGGHQRHRYSVLISNRTTEVSEFVTCSQSGRMSSTVEADEEVRRLSGPGANAVIVYVGSPIIIKWEVVPRIGYVWIRFDGFFIYRLRVWSLRCNRGQQFLIRLCLLSRCHSIVRQSTNGFPLLVYWSLCHPKFFVVVEAVTVNSRNRVLPRFFTALRDRERETKRS